MADAMKKVSTGDPLRIPAQAYNAFIDAARDFQQRTAQIGQQATPGYRSAGIVLVKNESGEARQRFDVLGLGEPVILPDAGDAAEQSFKNAVAFRGDLPDETEHKGKFVILAEPLATNAIGRAYLAGVTAVRLRLEDSAQKVKAAEIIDADATALQPSSGGSAAVLWHQEQTGDVWAIVRLGNVAPAGIWVQIATTEASGGKYSSWQEVELTDDGEGGLTWTAKADGLAGPADGVIYEVNGVENIADETVVQAFPNPAYDPEAADPLPAWLFQYEQPEVIGYGVPAEGEVDVPHDADIDLTVTDAAGNPILDAQGQEQTIKVWRNALKRALYTDFQPGTVFVYVKFPQPAPSGHGGCIFSRTEAFKSYREWLPENGYSLYPGEQPPASTNATGDPGNDKHAHVIGKMFMEDTADGKGWAPWFVIDPEKFGGKNELLDGTNHTDTADADPVAGDMIYAHADEENVVWDRLPVGAGQSIMRVDAAGLPSWLAKGWEQSILYVNGGVLDWFNAGAAQSILITGAGGNLAWKPHGLNESIFITRGGQLDWLTKGDDGSLLGVDNGLLAWLPKGNDQSLLYMNVNKPDWFLPGLPQSMLITGLQGLAWKPRGPDESIYITRNQQLDWLAKGDNPSILTTLNGTVSWTHGVDQIGLGAVPWINPNGVFEWVGPAYHALLGTDWHYDTSNAIPLKGDMIYMTADPPNGVWDVIRVGGDQAILYVNNGLPAWLSASVTVGDSLAIGDDGKLAWQKFNLLDASHHWDTSGQGNPPARGSMIVGAPMLDSNIAWQELTAGQTGSILYIDNNSDPTWLPKGQENQPLHSTADGLEWFDGPSQTLTLVTDVYVEGTALKKKTRSVTVTKGLITEIGEEQTATIDEGTTCPT